MTYIYFNQGVAKEAVFAIPGTHKPLDVAQDFEGWNADANAAKSGAHLPGVFAQVKSDFIHARNCIKQQFPNALIYLTGHSLGGALSHLLVCRGGFALPSIGFNPPGIGHLPGVHTRLSHNLLNFNSLYGFINKIGMPLGRTVVIDVPNDRTQAIALHQTLNKKMHEAMLAQAKANNAEDAVARMRSLIKEESQASASTPSNTPFSGMIAGGLAQKMQKDTHQFALQSKRVEILQHHADALRYKATIKAHVFGHFTPSSIDYSSVPLLFGHEVAAFLKTTQEGAGPIYQQHSLPNLIDAIRAKPNIANAFALSFLITKNVKKAA